MYLSVLSLSITEVTYAIQEIDLFESDEGKGSSSKTFIVKDKQDGSPIHFRLGRTERERISGSRKRYFTRESNKNWT